MPAGQCLGQRLRVADEIESTHLEARRKAETWGKHANSEVLLCELQTAGRGRQRAGWWSGPRGANLTVSLILAQSLESALAVMLLAARAAAEAAQAEVGAKRVALKWPNDLLVDGAKAAGLIAEQLANGCTVLSMGVNLQIAPPREVAPYPVTALRHGARREDFLARWLISLERGLTHWQRKGPATLEADYLRLLRAWAPHGVSEPQSGQAGSLLQFSVQDGLTWGEQSAPFRRPLGQLHRLEALAAPTV